MRLWFSCCERIVRAEVGDEFALRNVVKLPRSFWVLVIVCITFYSAFLPFIGLSTYGLLHPSRAWQGPC